MSDFEPTLNHAQVSETPSVRRRGWLRNGNTPGDFHNCKRCGAKTRAGTPCKSPAMHNARCRMHGGKSTGPRTAEGRERIRSAILKHGKYSQATRKEALLLRIADDAFMIRYEISQRSINLRTDAALSGSASSSSDLTPNERDQLSQIYRRWQKADPENREIARIVKKLDRGQLAGDDLDGLLLTDVNLIFEIVDKRRL
jgi:hypothetical protein